MKRTQKEWARYIQDEIKKNGSYDNYKHAFIEYKDYLEKCLLENPRDVEKGVSISNSLFYSISRWKNECECIRGVFEKIFKRFK